MDGTTANLNRKDFADYTRDDWKARAAELRADAKREQQRRAESIDRSDTDGFLSQWAHDLNARLSEARARICDAGGMAEFEGLYAGDRRVRAKVVETRYGARWLVHQTDRGRAGGREWLPTGARSRVLKQLGLAERVEIAPAWACLDGSGTGLSGTAYVRVYRRGDEWGADAVADTLQASAVYYADHNDGRGLVEERADLSAYRVGQEYAAHAGAPGVGRVVWRCTRVDEQGAWGVVTENTIHVPGDGY
jgi:hypothetical protein